MKKYSVLCALALAATMATQAGAVATIDVAWDNCAFDATPAHNQNVTFACDGSRDATAPYRLFATLHAPTGGYPSLAALQAHTRESVAGYKVPRDLVLVDKIVRSPAGKADYRWAKQAATDAVG